jgi:hypothetical protein
MQTLDKQRHNLSETATAVRPCACKGKNTCDTCKYLIATKPFSCTICFTMVTGYHYHAPKKAQRFLGGKKKT